jgi:hypothetical protein
MNTTPLIRSIVSLFAITSLFSACAADKKSSDKDGWKLLFDGKTTAGWRSYAKKDFPVGGWVAEDNCLHLLPEKRPGDIITVDKFTDYELEWDWKIAPKANNGIKYLVTTERPGSPGHEYQMVDDSTEAGTGPKHRTGSFYEVLPPDDQKTHVHPPGEWNHSRLIIHGNHVEHWLNDEKILAYELGSPEVKAAVAQSKFKDAAGFGDKITGHIMLTDHHGETWYRNIRIRELSPKS